jgi:hypothetical protein
VTAIRTNSWVDFTSAVAEAFKAGESVIVQVQPESDHAYIAKVGETAETE